MKTTIFSRIPCLVRESNMQKKIVGCDLPYQLLHIYANTQTETHMNKLTHEQSHTPTPTDKHTHTYTLSLSHTHTQTHTHRQTHSDKFKTDNSTHQ